MQEVRDRFSRLEQKGVSTKAAVAEMIGTGIYVLAGSLVVTHLYHDHADALSNVAIMALAFGLAAIVAIYTTAHNSGGQLNPAVTIGMAASGITSGIQAVANIVGQGIGALLAIVALRVLVPHATLKGGRLAGNFVPEDSNVLRAFLGEAAGMFFIQLVYLETGHHKDSRAGNAAPLAIGLAYTVAILALAPISSAALNPARALAPALLSGHLKHVWLFVLGPICGALLAAPVHLFSITDIDTTLRRVEQAADERSTEPLLPDRA